MDNNAKQDRSCETPLVSILLPCFNDLDTLPVALSSLIAQSFEDWECILVDDGSDSPIEHVTQHFSDRRIRLIKLHQNRGRSIARNRALDEACGKYICFLDADDWYYPKKLETQLAFMEGDESIAACATGISYADQDDQLIGMNNRNRESHIINLLPRTWDVDFCFASVMLRRDVIGAHRFDPGLGRSEDIDFLTGVLYGKQYAILPYIGYAYRTGFSKEFFRNALLSSQYARKSLANRFPRARVKYSLAYGKTVTETAVYTAILWSGLGQWVLRQGFFPRRRCTPTHEEEVLFRKARDTVYNVMNVSESAY